jgi:hypothetical protein
VPEYATAEDLGTADDRATTEFALECVLIFLRDAEDLIKDRQVLMAYLRLATLVSRYSAMFSYGG